MSMVPNLQDFSVLKKIEFFEFVQIFLVESSTRKLSVEWLFKVYSYNKWTLNVTSITSQKQRMDHMPFEIPEGLKNIVRMQCS